MQVKLGQRLAAADQRAPHGEGTQQGLEDWLHLENNARSHPLEHRNVATELQRVPESLIGIHEKGLALERLLPRPSWALESTPHSAPGLQLQARLVQAPGVVELSHRELQYRLGPGGRRIIGLDRECAVEVAESLLVTPQTPQCEARVGESVRVVGPQHHGTHEIWECLSRPEQTHQHRAAVIERLRGVAIECQGLVETRDRLLITPQRCQRDAALKVRIKLPRGQRHRPVETRERLGWLTELEADFAAPQVSRRRIGCKR